MSRNELLQIILVKMLTLHGAVLTFSFIIKNEACHAISVLIKTYKIVI